MRPVIDSSGVRIKNLYQKYDGSLVVKDDAAFARSKTAKEAFDTLNKEVADLKQQIQLILEKINAIH